MKHAALLPRLAVPLVSILLTMAPVAFGQEECRECHEDASLFADDPDGARLVVTQASLDASVHGAAGLECVDCHQDLQGADLPHDEKLAKVNCGTCHEDVQRAFSGSVHGYALERGNRRAPDCWNCHGKHEILASSDPRSPTHKVRLVGTCASCHGTAGLLTDQLVRLPQSFTDYAQSVHGQGTERGISAAASCSDCHGTHDLRGPADPRSRINPLNVAATCGACHPDIQLQYDRSIHGRALRAGISDSPTCIGCHGEHLILRPSDPDAKTHSSRLAVDTCARCHNDPVIASKYQMQRGVVSSYVDSYHGWASRREYARAATCVSCHSTHLVLPAQDPGSTVNAANVVATCAQCHPRADASFAASYTHEKASIATNPVDRFIRNFYLVVIALVIGGMVVHNLVIMNYFMVQRRKEEASNESVVRFDRTQVAQHLLLTLAFVVLAITGFALRFPDAWWVQSLSALGMSEPLRANLHRIASVLLIGVALSHMYYVFLTRRGTQELQALMPRGRDFVELLQNLSFHTWRSDQPARFGRYDYSQKAEYWALIWGTLLMILTGFVLWFPAAAVRVFPSWIVTASQTIHYYEAWLATLAIVVWHFFFVVFHPEQYPMSWTWLTGKMPVKAVREHHARWYEEEIEPRETPAKGTGDR